MKTIIILGEEYWFFKPDQPKFTEATYLLNKITQSKYYNIKIIKNPGELLKTVQEIKPENIKAIFLFQDVLSDSNLNNKTILQMHNYLKDLINKGVYLYPQVNIIDNFGGKKYYKTLVDKLPYASLPHTVVLNFNNYNPKTDETKIINKLYETVTSMWKTFNKVVVKKGYSYEGKQVKIFNRETITDFKQFEEKAKTLNYKKFFGVGSNAIFQDRGIDRYYIVQGFNKIVTKRSNELRVFFHNGVARYIATGDELPNVCVQDKLKDNFDDNSDTNLPLHNEIVKFAKKLFKDYIPLIWKEKRPPILIRIDVSYAVDPQFIDEYAINIKGFDTPVRIYANELEVDPTSYFYNNFTCKSDDKFSSKAIQENMGKYINKYIKLIKHDEQEKK